MEQPGEKWTVFIPYVKQSKLHELEDFSCFQHVSFSLNSEIKHLARVSDVQMVGDKRDWYLFQVILTVCISVSECAVSLPIWKKRAWQQRE